MRVRGRSCSSMDENIHGTMKERNWRFATMRRCLVFTVLAWLFTYPSLIRAGPLDTASPATQTDATSGTVSPTNASLVERTLESDLEEPTSTGLTLGMVTSITDQTDQPVHCDQVLCEISHGLFLMNSSMCHVTPRFQISATRMPSTVNIWPDPSSSSYTSCQWNFTVAKHHLVFVSFEQVTNTDGYVNIEIIYDQYRTVTYKTKDLTSKAINVTVNSDIQIKYTNFIPSEMVNVTFHYVAIQILLPSVQISNSTGYVTSPGFQPGGSYPLNYDGTYRISVPENYSVIIKFTHFNVEPHNCTSDFVILYAVKESSDPDTIIWKKCGTLDIPPQIYRFSIQLQFVTDGYFDYYSGFKMKYAILPTYQEPIVLSESMYDCSVPHFKNFSYVFRCNLVPECQGNEDEKDCEHHYLPLAKCTGVPCQTGPHFFVIDASSCLQSPEFKFNGSTEVSTVVIVVKPLPSDRIACNWHVVVPDKHALFLTFKQVSSDSGMTSIEIKGNNNVLNINKANLQKGTLNFTDQFDVYFYYQNYKPYTSAGIQFDFHVKLNILPVEKLSESVGFITSPNFMRGQYPKEYTGIFNINVSENYSVLVNVIYLEIPGSGNCENTFLYISEEYIKNARDQTKSKLCGYHQRKSLLVFNSSVHIQFQSKAFPWKGFKMRYAILPTQLQPQKIPGDNLYNCSVPHFSLFKPVISCNFIVECQAKEDETGCDYSGKDCGPGAVEDGTKCITLERPDADTTWYTSNSICKSKQQQLVTIVNNETANKIKQMDSAYDIFDFYVGLQLTTQSSTPPLSSLYRTVWQWVDGRSAFSIEVTRSRDYILDISFPLCSLNHVDKLSSAHCFKLLKVDIICEYDKPVVNKTLLEEPAAENTNVTFANLTMVPCRLGQVTRDFLLCDSQSQCDADSQESCLAESNRVFMFQCKNEELIPYTLVCDHVVHCTDGSDESFCQFRLCPSGVFQCNNRQCVNINGVCDGRQDCFDNSDEVCQLPIDKHLTTVHPPAIITMNGYGNYSMVQSSVCPVTHFRCLDGYCLPIFLRCNGISDCIGGEDEVGCDTYLCQGFYRCRGSKVCLHPKYMCDSIFHCPQYDDELLCQAPTCPTACSCQGLAFSCSQVFSISSFPDLRYLDMSNTKISTDIIPQSYYLVGLRLSRSGITEITKLDLPNLQQFDLSYNGIVSINVQSLVDLTNLRRLILTGNPVVTILTAAEATAKSASSNSAQQMKEIDLSYSQLETYNSTAFTSYPHMEVLNLSNSRLYKISDGGFSSSPKLKMIDLRKTRLKQFPNDLLKNLTELKTVYSDIFILCCEAMLPTGFDLTQCHAEQDLLASCKELLRSDIYRIFLWIFASLSVIGNFGSFIGRMYLNKEDKKLGSFSILVTNLTVADFFMGVYLIIIGAADQVYLGNYLWNSEQWKNSATCSLAGFLSLMSSEVSAFIICLITLDRFLVLCFPFSTFHFRQKSALVACAIAWTLGIILAGIPLMPFASHWEYYSQTGICIPLPFGSSDRFEGQAYSFAIMIVINFVVFLLIAMGQIVIFWSIRKNTMATAKDATSRQATIARRLTTIVVSDFLCWFPIGLLGLMAFTGTQIPGEIKVAVAIFVLPFNSALNPFLYTFNTLMEKRQKAMENILLQRLEKTYQTNVKSSVAKPSNFRQQPEHSEQFSTSITNTENGARL